MAGSCGFVRDAPDVIAGRRLAQYHARKGSQHVIFLLRRLGAKGSHGAEVADILHAATISRRRRLEG
jgi:hypothetical protein